VSGLAAKITFVFAFFISLESVAWSRNVHSDIGGIVFSHLSKKEQRYYQQLASKLPQKDLRFNDMSAWVDSIRGEPIFEVFDTQVPIALKPFSQKHSGTWHYENSFYFKPQEYYSCDLTNGGNLRLVLKALDNALKESLTKTQVLPARVCQKLCFEFASIVGQCV